MHLKAVLCILLLCPAAGASAASTVSEPDTVSAEQTDSIYTLLNRSRSFLDDESYDSALIVSRQAYHITESYPDLPDSAVTGVYNLLGLCQFRLGRSDSAESLWARALANLEADNNQADSLMAEIITNIGRLRLSQRRLDEADSCVRQAMAIREKLFGTNHPQTAFSLSALATVESAQGRQEEAELHYLQAIRLMRDIFGENHPDHALMIRDLAVHYDRVGRYSEADSLHRQELEINKRLFGTKDARVAGSMNSIALIAYKTGRYDEADSLHRMALDILRETVGDYHAKIVRTLSNLANVHLTRSEYTEAETLYRQALDIGTKIYGTGHKAYMRLLVNLAAIYHGTADYTQAESLYVIARDIARGIEGNDGPDVAFVEANLASILNEQGRYASAEPMYEHSTAVFERSYGPRHPYVASNLYNLAFLYDKQGRYYEAIDVLKRAISISKETEGPDHPVVAQDIHMLAGIHASMGRTEEAEELYRQALEMREKAFGMDNAMTVNTLGCLADLKLERGEFDEAERMHRRIWEIREQIFGLDNRFTAHSIGNTAKVLYHAGKYEEAEALDRQSLDILMKVLEPNHPDLANARDGLAISLSAQGKYDEAIALHRQALHLRETLFGPNHPNVGENLEDMAKAYTAVGNYDSSLTCYQRLLSLRQRFINYVFSFSSEEQKLLWIKRYPLQVPSLPSCALFCRDITAVRLAFEMTLKAKALVIEAMLAEREAAYCSDDNRIREMLEDRTEICTQISALSIADRDIPEHRDSLQWLFDVQDSLESELSQKCSPFREELLARHFRTNEIAAALPSGAVLWEFIQYKPFDFISPGDNGTELNSERYAAFILDCSGTVELVDLGEARVIDSLIRAARESIDESSGRVYTALAADYERRIAAMTHPLYQLLFEPLSTRLNGQTDIIISPDGALGLLPFEILPDSSGKYVIEDYRISYLSSGRDLLKFVDGKKMNDLAVIIADPDFNGPSTATNLVAGFDNVDDPSRDSTALIKTVASTRGSIDCLPTAFTPLRHGQEEGAAMASILKAAAGGVTVDEYYHERARESVLKQLAEPPRILHIITHGFFCAPTGGSEGMALNHPLLHSGLALAGANYTLQRDNGLDVDGEDGILVAYEVSGLNLTGTELVTLSACETGVGTSINGEGVFGLRRAFRHAGAEAIMMSLWNIPDKETALLMKEFYTIWLGGESKGRALHRASLEALRRCRSEHGHGHPFLWAGFVMTGNPR